MKIYKNGGDYLRNLTIITSSVIITLTMLSLVFAENNETYTILIQFENRSLRGDGIERYNESYAQYVAQKLFDEKVPDEFKDTLFLKEIEKFYHFYSFNWDRKIDGIPVANEGFSLWVDYSNGNVVLWTLRLGYPSSQIDLTSSLSSDQAKYVITKAYGQQPVKEPTLLVNGKKLNWIVDIKGASFGLDADTGETLSFSVTEGSNIQKVSTSFNPTKYYLERFGIYAVVIAVVAIIGGVVYWKKLKSNN
jgi:hypothetical protein